MNINIMNLNCFIENFADQFEETDAGAFTPDTKFKELEEWNSLVALSVIAMVDEEYDITLKGDDIRSAITINDLFVTIKEKM